MEIERKFLITGEQWRGEIKETLQIRQGYIVNHNGQTVRIRTFGKKGYLTIKGPRDGISRVEFEYEIPFADANELLNRFCVSRIIEKKRHIVFYKGQKWEIDEFFGENEGLIIAEAELENVNQFLEIPEWVGEEVSYDNRYYNSNLVKKPFKTWGK